MRQRSPDVEIVRTWSEPSFGRRHARTIHVLLAASILAVVVAPFAIAGPPARQASPTQQNFTEPVKITASAAADYLLKVRNTANDGRGARIMCTSPGEPCLYVTNPAGGPAAKFRGSPGVPPFEVGPDATKVPNLNADLVDGLSAEQIVERATQQAGGSRPPTGPAGGALTGTYPDPGIAAGAITDANVAGANKDGAAATPSLRTLGTGANQAAAGNDPRLSDARTPTGAAGGDLTGTYPNPTLADASIDSVTLFTAGLQDGAAGTPTLRSLGTGANQAAAGNDPRLSDSRAPTGPAGGDLTGSYPDPTLGADSVGPAEIGEIPNAHAIATTAQAFPTGAPTRVALNNLSFGSDVTLDDANDELVVATPGVYAISAEVQWTNNTDTTARFVYINRNNVAVELVGDARLAVNGSTTNQSAATVARFGAGDTIFVLAGHGAAAPLSTEVFLGRSAALNANWVAP